jgi:carboxylesterase type B
LTVSNFSDAQFQSQARFFADTFSAHTRVYKYFFNHIPQVEYIKSQSILGVFHGAEIPYVFQYAPQLSPAELSLSKTMNAYWRSFATQGYPDETQSWRVYNASSLSARNSGGASFVIGGESSESILNDARDSSRMAFWLKYDAAAAAAAVST